MIDSLIHTQANHELTAHQQVHPQSEYKEWRKEGQGCCCKSFWGWQYHSSTPKNSQFFIDHASCQFPIDIRSILI